MSDTLTSTTTEAGLRDPGVSDGQAGGLPVRPASGRHGTGRSRTAVPGSDLGRQHTVAHHGLRGSAGAVLRLPGQRRRPGARLSALERRHVVDRAQAPAIGVHRRRRRAHPIPADAVEAVHLQAGGRPAADHPADHRRPHRRDAGRTAAGRHRHRAGAAGPVAGDQPAAGGALRGRRDVPAPRQRRAGALRHRRGHRQRRDEPAQIPGSAGRGQDGKSGRGCGVRSGRAGQGR